MKILRIFGIVAAVHMFAFLFIMANPGCSTKGKPQAPVSAGDSMAAAPNAGEGSSPFAASAPAAAQEEAGGISFNPQGLGGSSRQSPSRPGSTASVAALKAEAEASTPVPVTVTVGRGDSLWSISKKQGVPVTELAAANKLTTSSVLSVGQKIVIPGKTTVPSPSARIPAPQQPVEESFAKTSAEQHAASAAPAGNGKVRTGVITHVVKPGEMLSTIARKYGVKSADIAVANNITNPAMIPSGKELIIPVGKSKSSAPAKSSNSGSSSKPAANTPAKDLATAPAPQPAPAPAPTPARSQRPVMPIIGGPSAPEDIPAAQINTSPDNAVPVIRVD